MKYIFLFLLSFCAFAKEPAQIKVAVLDTGLSVENIVRDNVKLCEPVHNLAPSDYVSLHGANVISIITNEAGPSEYCLVVYKVFSGVKLDGPAYNTALKEIASRPDISVLHLSLSGRIEDAQETQLITRILDHGVTVVAAAGNDAADLGRQCIAYPACIDPRIVVVGNKGIRSSNYGSPVDIFEDGVEREGGGIKLTGTSQAAATFTGKLIRKTNELRLRGTAK